MIETKYIMASIIFSVIGIVILLITFWIVEKISPEHLWKQVVEKQNVALAIMAAGFMIAMAIIISSAIHG
jgi:putative membrane protein